MLRAVFVGPSSRLICIFKHVLCFLKSEDCVKAINFKNKVQLVVFTLIALVTDIIYKHFAIGMIIIYTYYKILWKFSGNAMAKNMFKKDKWWRSPFEEQIVLPIYEMYMLFSGKTCSITQEDKAFLSKWLEGLPVVPSHYCRNTPSYQNKRFLEPGTTIANLHHEYRKAAEQGGHRSVCIKIFSETFHDLNYSVFIPRKDQCDICVSTKHGNTDEATYKAHIQAKNDAREEKAKDKDDESSKTSVWTVDVQAVLLCPKTRASAMYYKTKLQVHNLSFFNLKTREGYCYVWDETQGDVNSEMFAYLQYQHFCDVLDAHPEIKEVIIWSDGCTYQNRNTNLANSLLHLAITRGVKIVQKYLVVGHTQMEVDSMHSSIERKIIGDMYLPHDYIVVMESARMRPSPYIVKQVSHDQILKLDGEYLTSIRPGKKTGDPTVYHLRALQFQPSGSVQYKLDFSNDATWKELPQRINQPRQVFSWVRHFPERLPITLRKFNDLQSMKHVMPQWAHDFYDKLPHGNL